MWFWRRMELQNVVLEEIGASKCGFGGEWSFEMWFWRRLELQNVVLEEIGASKCGSGGD